MRFIDFKKGSQELKDFPHQLTKWTENREDLDNPISNFVKYGEEAKAIIVKDGDKLAIFTTGEYSYAQKEKSHKKPESLNIEQDTKNSLRQVPEVIWVS